MSRVSGGSRQPRDRSFLVHEALWLRSRVPRPAIGPYVRLCSARCGYDDPQSTNSPPSRSRCSDHRREPRSCLTRGSLMEGRSPDRQEERPRPPVGQARNETQTARRSALATTPICSARSAQRGASSGQALPYADTDMMQLHLDEISSNVAKGRTRRGDSRQGRVAHHQQA